jgi:Flp pilus assembly protein TadG
LTRSGRRRRGRGERGQSAVEIGILLPIFLVLILGVVEVNSALNSYISVVNASRDGARLGSKGAATDAAIRALVKKDLARLPNTTPDSNVTITTCTTSACNGTLGNYVKVEACYDHSTLVGLKLVVPKSFHMCASTTLPKLN